MEEGAREDDVEHCPTTSDISKSDHAHMKRMLKIHVCQAEGYERQERGQPLSEGAEHPKEPENLLVGPAACPGDRNSTKLEQDEEKSVLELSHKHAFESQLAKECVHKFLHVAVRVVTVFKTAKAGFVEKHAGDRVKLGKSVGWWDCGSWSSGS